MIEDVAKSASSAHMPRAATEDLTTSVWRAITEVATIESLPESTLSKSMLSTAARGPESSGKRNSRESLRGATTSSLLKSIPSENAPNLVKERRGERREQCRSSAAAEIRDERLEERHGDRLVESLLRGALNETSRARWSQAR